MCVCLMETERECNVCVSERGTVCVYVCVFVFERERKCVCVFERDTVSVCV